MTTIDETSVNYVVTIVSYHCISVFVEKTLVGKVGSTVRYFQNLRTRTSKF